MAVLPIVMYPNEILERPCEQVTIFNDKLGILLDNMFDTMIAADGVGLAAPQIGINQQIAIVFVNEEISLVELINPEIIDFSGEQTGVEGCLSFPEVYGIVTRPYSIKVKAQDRYGNFFTVNGEGYFARALFHEIDHLHGKLFTDKIERRLTLEEVMEIQTQSEVEEA